MKFRGVYTITDSALLPGYLLIESVTQALEVGISLLQYRNKIANWQEKFDKAKLLQEICASYAVPLIINDDVHLCQESNANVIDLGQSDTSLEQARSLLGNEAIVGVTCYGDITPALQVQHSDADYAAFGQFFSSVTKPTATGSDLKVLSQAKEKLSIPVIAIDGINAENVHAAIDCRRGHDCCNKLSI